VRKGKRKRALKRIWGEKRKEWKGEKIKSITNERGGEERKE
jgi:hypothetical protein